MTKKLTRSVIITNETTIHLMSPNGVDVNIYRSLAKVLGQGQIDLVRNSTIELYE